MHSYANSLTLTCLEIFRFAVGWKGVWLFAVYAVATTLIGVLLILRIGRFGFANGLVLFAAAYSGWDLLRIVVSPPVYGYPYTISRNLPTAIVLTMCFLAAVFLFLRAGRRIPLKDSLDIESSERSSVEPPTLRIPYNLTGLLPVLAARSLFSILGLVCTWLGAWGR